MLNIKIGSTTTSAFSSLVTPLQPVITCRAPRMDLRRKNSKLFQYGVTTQFSQNIIMLITNYNSYHKIQFSSENNFEFLPPFKIQYDPTFESNSNVVIIWCNVKQNNSKPIITVTHFY